MDKEPGAPLFLTFILTLRVVRWIDPVMAQWLSHILVNLFFELWIFDIVRIAKNHERNEAWKNKKRYNYNSIAIAKIWKHFLVVCNKHTS